MKQKIKEALQQGYKNLGLSVEALERVAASVETFISDEADIQKFVDSELVKSLMKFEQADADRKRTKREKDVKSEGEKATENGNEPKVEEAKVEEMPVWAKQLMEQNEALAKQNESLAADLTAFKAAQTQKTAVAALDELKSTWDYAQGYPEESEYAYKLTMGIYNGIGKTWNANELTAKYKEFFNERVGEKGVDTAQPFKSEANTNVAPDFSNELAMLKAAGVELPK